MWSVHAVFLAERFFLIKVFLFDCLPLFICPGQQIVLYLPVLSFSTFAFYPPLLFSSMFFLKLSHLFYYFGFFPKHQNSLTLFGGLCNFFFNFLSARAINLFLTNKVRASAWEVWVPITYDAWHLSRNAFVVPSGPPRGVEAETVNSSAVRVTWWAPAPERQHGQIRGYQIHYVRMNYGEPQGQPFIKDILTEDSQVTQPYTSSSSNQCIVNNQSNLIVWLNPQRNPPTVWYYMDILCDEI